MEQAKGFFPGAIIFVEALDPFKSASKVNQGGGSRASN